MGEPFIALASPIVGDLIKDIASFIKKQYHLAKGVEEDIKKLESKFTAIQSVLEDAEEKQVKSKALKDWLAKLSDVAYDAGDVLDSFSTQVYLSTKKQQAHCNCFRFPIASHKYDAALEIKKLLARVEEIANEKEKLHLKRQQGDSVRPAEISRETTHRVDESGVVGREADIEKIIDVLRSGDSDNDCNFTAIAITGMGGIGKTTLAKLVFNNQKIMNHSDTPLRMWVSVGIDFDLKRILREMIASHSKMPMNINTTRSQLESQLLANLEGKLFLLVLDDVWDVNSTDWESLKELLKKGGKGSKVLVTSRQANMLKALRIEVVHDLSVLPDDECWSLFKKMAFKQGGSPNGAQREVLEEIGKKIVDKCKGLPLAVKAMGGLLWGNVDVQTWRNILDSWIWQVQESPILPALKLSYYHLPPCLKQCFAFCSLFPKGYSFSKKELIKLWMAEAYIQSRGQERAEVTGNQYFHDLLMRSFFQSSNVGTFSQLEREETYRMHDLIHDLALIISRPHSCQERDKLSENTRHASLLCEDVEQPALEIIGKSKKLRTLLFPTDYLKNFGQALDKMFRTMRFMRVLDLSSSTIQELPESVKKLKLLRYLNLSKTEIKRLPNSICNLYHLETLILLGCLWLFELPKDLGNLINLRHLELDEMFWYKASTLPPRIGSLINLENLHAFQVGRGSGYGIDELKKLKYLTGALHISKLENVVNAGDANLKEKESLQKVVLEWSDRDTGDDATEARVLEGLEPHSKIEELQICHYRGSTFPAWMRDELFQNLVSISLKHCTKCKILSLGQLPQLKHLSIKGMRDLEEWADLPSPSLEMLTVLKISNCPKLRQLPPFFPNLEVLKIKKCDSLRALRITIWLRFLILVDNLVLEDCATVNDQGQVVAVEHLPFLCRIFCSLNLKIISCPMMQSLPGIFALYNVEISRCPLLTALPISERFTRLHYMALDACPDGTLVRAILSTSPLETLVISNISNLSSLTKWSKLPRLKALYIRDCKDLESLSEEEEEEEVLEALSEEEEEGSLRSLKSEEEEEEVLESLSEEEEEEGLLRSLMSEEEEEEVLESLSEEEEEGSLRSLMSEGLLRRLMSEGLLPEGLLPEGLLRSLMSDGLLRSLMSDGLLRSLMSEEEEEVLESLSEEEEEGLSRRLMSEGLSRRLMSDGLLRSVMPSLPSSTSLKILSIRGCPNLVTLASQGLPAALECLIIGSCPKLNSLGPNDILKRLTSLMDLYIEDCPMLQSLPEEGLSSSLQHLHIQGCPLLTKRCQEEAEGGQDWPKIRHIPNLEIIEVPSAPHLTRPSWYKHFKCFQGIDIGEPGELKWKSNSVGITPRDRGINIREPVEQQWQRNAVGLTRWDYEDLNNVLLPTSCCVKKKWVDKSGNNIFMIYARSLFITWGGHEEHWTWNCFKETGEENIEVAKLIKASWLDVRGYFKMSDLSPGIEYEIAYVVKLTNGAYGFDLPIKLKLILPGGKISQRQVCLLEKPRGEWIELKVGHFKVEAAESLVWFELLEHEDQRWKNGLIVKGVIVRPKI